MKVEKSYLKNRMLLTLKKDFVIISYNSAHTQEVWTILLNN